MNRRLSVVVALGLVGCAPEPAGDLVELPGGSPGIGFDDLRYSPSLHRVLVPGGRSGRLNLVNPDTLEVTSIPGLSQSSDYSGGHDDGPTSVDEARGRLFVTDRTSHELVMIDPVARTILGETGLNASPDYVRYVASRQELWIAEPSADQIEIFSWPDDDVMPVSVAIVPFPNGPESLVIDESRGRAYTHHWQGSTVAIELDTRKTVATWPNGCAASRGIALDEERGWLFAACSEGTAAVIDVTSGELLSTLQKGAGFDVIGYAPELRHLYLAGSACDCLIIARVSNSGTLHLVERVPAPGESTCVTADDAGHAWVCDPEAGSLYRVDDPKGG